ncbi:phosphatidylinositol phosphatase PTPRQ-like [Patiria miniata]|uniref:Fibronectin type-III domain-containing protein n=1 Tax=Patiria miniata TaxID=46514 RepID=A0A913ZEY9_PATMI|nr:phosphatidylinositol phosphatase PTPRQ-like [Patiria miniata]
MASEISVALTMLVLVMHALTGAEATGQVQNLTAVNVEDAPGDVLVTWLPPEAPDSPVQFYRVSYELFDMAQCSYIVELTRVVAGEMVTETSYTIGGLLPYSGYQVIVEASTSTGLQEEAIVSVFIPEAVPTDPPRGVRNLGSSSSTILAFTWDDIECSIGARSSAFRGFYYELTSVDQPTNAPITKLVPHGPAWIYDLSSFHLYSFRVAIRSRAGDGPFSEPLEVRTKENTPTKPAAFQVSETTETSVTCSWEEPLQPNGVITNYTITLRPSDRPYDPSFTPPLSATVIRHLEPDIFMTKFDDLEPSSFYELSTTAWTSTGAGGIAILNTFTRPKSDIQGPSLPVVDPYTSNETSVTITLKDPDDHYVTSYLVAVESDAPRSKRSPVVIDGKAFRTYSDNPHAYIAAEIPKAENTSSVVVGDGQTYGDYLNAPLANGRQYRIWIGSKSAIDWRSSVSWSATLKVTAGDYEFPPTAPSSTPSKGHSAHQQWILGAAPWLFMLWLWLY